MKPITVLFGGMEVLAIKVNSEAPRIVPSGIYLRLGEPVFVRWASAESNDITYPETRTYGTIKCDACNRAVHFAAMGQVVCFPWEPYVGWIAWGPTLMSGEDQTPEVTVSMLCPSCRQTREQFAAQLF